MNGVRDELLSMARIGAVTKENLREGDLSGPILALNNRATFANQT
jgi:hypothetical protein